MALHHAASRGDADELTALLQNGQSVEAKDKDGNTSLHFAAARGHPLVAIILLANGAHDLARNNEGTSPIQLAHQFIGAPSLEFIEIKDESGRRIFRGCITDVFQMLEKERDQLRQRFEIRQSNANTQRDSVQTGAPPVANKGSLGKIKFRCTKCNKSLVAERTIVGKNVKCPQCGMNLIVP
jgi:DNA-directed RNA polymerase subunit RPC12/RpoP